MVRQIKLMWDYDCWPLWHFGGSEAGNIDPDSLPLSRETRTRLSEWAAISNAKLNRNDPPSTEWTKEEKLAIEAEGRQIWKVLQRELGKDYQVVYYSSIEHKVLEPNRKDTI